ncbi:MAG: hypothetical protein AN488_17395 [Anabaena sp. WA113]|jgi:hypothetical protein|uniref:HicB-like antitoxin of toxin-antitoxin system domain-containing protein n=1 Tax=Aphanizomenon flos-aquae WA102 TaxID=1710896 RepID=A0A1B7X4H3_APHFL|nr:type II toxin-antitoxin system HicB family antitoxin [Nostocales cyanobacterium W4_Combined_metabat2_030]OBQ18219.1 MAG: hypothetical protein AN488_17395 [Anabaena sp. WA113]OBQ44252.1 MAG: hypothetical protein AN484_08055 [Aphanizomenon flos-aquae WA102]
MLCKAASPLIVAVKVEVCPAFRLKECPSLKGCVSQGRTKSEALINIKEVITGYIATLETNGLPIP